LGFFSRPVLTIQTAFPRLSCGPCKESLSAAESA
jgi:hypothetical protein